MYGVLFCTRFNLKQKENDCKNWNKRRNGMDRIE